MNRTINTYQNFGGRMLRIIYAITLLSIGSTPSMAEESKSSVLMDHQVLYDGVLKSHPAPYLRGSGKNEQGRGVIMTVTCGHLIVTSGPKQLAMLFSLPDHGLYSCRQTIVGIDFTNRAVLSLIDLTKNAQAVKSDERSTYPVTRYLARNYAQPVIFFEGISSVQITGDQKIDSLAMVIQRLADAQLTLGQNRYLDGTVIVEVAGPMKFDPENLGIVYPNDQSSWPDRKVEFGIRTPGWDGRLLPVETRFEKLKYEVVSQGNLVKEHPKPTELFTALTKTLSILKSGYKDLKINSDDANQAQFKNLIAENAEVISTELSQAIQLMNQNNYHIVEMGWFVSQVGELIDAIDGILKNSVGSEPGLIEIIRETEQG